MKLLRPFVGFFLASLAASLPVQAIWKNFDDATVILGRRDLPSPSNFYQPQDIAVNAASGKVFVVDGGNNRVLRFSSAAALANGVAAEAVFGQPDLFSCDPGLGQGRLNSPQAAAVDAAGHLWVTDTDNIRVLRWDNADTATSGALAAQVLGQPDFNTRDGHVTQDGLLRPGGLTVDSLGHLWVVDYFNNRVLRYDNPSSKGNGGAADGLLGQALFTTRSSGTSANQFDFPYDVVADAQGRLWVSDFGNARILRFDAPAAQIQPVANGVLGQPDFISSDSGGGPAQNNRVITIEVTQSGSLFALDSQNSRILRWDNAAAKANGANADGVLGRTGLNDSSGFPNTPGTISPEVRGMASDASGHLWTVDRQLERVLRWDNATAKANGAAADGVIGQPDTATTYFANYDPSITLTTTRGGVDDPVSKKFFVGDSGRVLRYASRAAAEAGDAPEAALGKSDLSSFGGGSPTATNLRSTWGLVMDSAGKLWVCDNEANRILAFANAATAPTGAAATVVLGQQNFTDSGPLRSQKGLSQPRGMALDAVGNLYVADFGNRRVLRFNSLATKTSGAGADAVIGQQDFTSDNTGTDPSLLDDPSGVCTDSSGHLWVADTGKNRVVRYDNPLTNSPLTPPSGTLGGLASIGVSGMAQPTAVAIDAQGRLFVLDYSFNRILRFDNADFKPNGAPADGVLGAPDFDRNIAQARSSHAFYRPFGLFLDRADNLWVGDENNTRLMRFSPRSSAVITESVLTSGIYSLTFHAEAGILYTVQSSLDLTNWKNEQGFLIENPGLQIFLKGQDGPKRFYRIEEP